MEQYQLQGSRGAHSHQASTQQLLMQQYEMHQRQLQQMQAFHEQERNRPMMQAHQHAHQQMQASAMMGSTSFDTSGDYSVSSPVSGPGQSMHLVGNNPMLMRVSMPSQTSPSDHYGSRSSSGTMMSGGGMSASNTSGQHGETFRPYAQVVAQEHPGHQPGGAFVAVHGGGGEGDGSPPEAWSIPPTSSLISKEDQSLSPGHMNPQATAFAPTYATGMCSHSLSSVANDISFSHFLLL